MKRLKAIIICSIMGLLMTSVVKAQETVEKKGSYLFSYFIGNGEDGLHLAYSHDGLKWSALNGGESYLAPAVGGKLMRDPNICQGPDGTFHMVWTSGWEDQVIGYSSSKDLIHWTRQVEIPVMKHEVKAKNAWAPEIYYDSDSKTYYIFWATTIPGKHKFYFKHEKEDELNHRIYYVTTKDFKRFSKTKMFFNPHFSVIDATLIKDVRHNDIIMILKNEHDTDKNLRVTRSRSLSKGFPIKVSEPITGNYWAEGPSPLFVNGTLYVYFDKYTQHKYGAVQSDDYGTSWKDISDEVSFPEGVRHGTAFPVEERVLDALMKPCNNK